MHKGRWVSAAVLLLGGTAAQAGGALQGLVSRDLATTSGRIAGAPTMRVALAAPALSSLSGPAGAALMGVTAGRALPGLELSSRSSSRSEDENHDEGGDDDGNGRGHENGHDRGNGRARGHENGHGHGRGTESASENWIQYNTETYPSRVNYWAQDVVRRNQTDIAAFAETVLAGPHPCDGQPNCVGGLDIEGYRTELVESTNDLIGAGNGANGLLGRIGPAPAPQLPDELASAIRPLEPALAPIIVFPQQEAAQR